MRFFEYDAEWHTVGRIGYPGHDENGFRNRVARTDPAHLIIGDSQVYGAGVAASASWPCLLDTAYNHDVYSVAMGGWGVLEYAMALDKYANTAVKAAYVCIYTGNDINEAFTHCKKSHSRLAKKFWDEEWADIDFAFDPDCRRRLTEVRKLRRAEGLSREQAVMRCVTAGVPDMDVATLNQETYVLTPGFRTQLLDLDIAANRCGLSVTKKAMEFMAGISDTLGFQLHIVVIPSREFVFRHRQETHKDVEFDKIEVVNFLYEREALVHRELANMAQDLALESDNIYHMLSEHLDRGVYKQQSDDGHPSEPGCELIAEYFHRELLQIVDNDEDDSHYPLY